MQQEYKFLKFETWVSIIRSRIQYHKLKNKWWVKERMNICKPCEYNSANVATLSIKDKIFKLLSLNSPICTACKCTLKYKTVEKYNVCGLEEINLEPKGTEHDK